MYLYIYLYIYIYIVLIILFVFYLGGWALHMKSFSNQNKGHVDFRPRWLICVHIDICHTHTHTVSEIHWHGFWLVGVQCVHPIRLICFNRVQFDCQNQVLVESRSRRHHHHHLVVIVIIIIIIIITITINIMYIMYTKDVCFQAPIFLVCSFSKTVAFPKGHRPSRQGADSGGAKLRLCGAKKTSPRCQFVSVFYITPPPTGKLTYDMASLNFTIDTSLNRCILPLSCKGRSNYYPGFFGVVVPKCFLYTEYLHRFPMISLWMWPFFTPCGPIFPALIWTLFFRLFLGRVFPYISRIRTPYIGE